MHFSAIPLDYALKKVLRSYLLYDIIKTLKNKEERAYLGNIELHITGCFMELWVTMFAARGKAAL